MYIWESQDTEGQIYLIYIKGIMSNERLFTSLTLSQSVLLTLNLENYLEGSQSW